MNKQSLNLSHLRSVFEQKIKYRFSLAHFKLIKNLIRVNQKSSRASNKVKHICAKSFALLVGVSTAFLIILALTAHAVYTNNLLPFDIILFLALPYVGIGTLCVQEINSTLFESNPVDSKTLTDLKKYISDSIKENRNLEFNYDLINYHLKLIDENSGEYAVEDLKEVFLHIKDVLDNHNQKVISDKKQEVLNLIGIDDATNLNIDVVNIKASLENTKTLYLNK